MKTLGKTLAAALLAGATVVCMGSIVGNHLYQCHAAVNGVQCPITNHPLACRMSETAAWAPDCSGAAVTKKYQVVNVTQASCDFFRSHDLVPADNYWVHTLAAAWTCSSTCPGSGN
jgi:hypothetical protein